MSDFFNQVSRRKFILTAGVSASAVLLKGCLGNPPETGKTGTKSSIEPVANISPEQKPETTTAKLGYIPIIESAPLIIAQEKGFFAKYGMSKVELAKQASWGSARDNVEIGSQGGGIDGGQWQMPMPHLITEGLITKGNKPIPMYVLAQLVMKLIASRIIILKKLPKEVTMTLHKVLGFFAYIILVIKRKFYDIIIN